jgi:hypothetical protein
MAQTEANEQENVEETEGNGANGAGKTAIRAAAIAAVSGATALAAKKAFVDRGGSAQDKPDRSQRKRGSNDVLSSMFSSGWDSAKDSLVPAIEDAAGHAGEFLARSGPEIVRETILPRFIDGFERARKSGDE